MQPPFLEPKDSSIARFPVIMFALGMLGFAIVADAAPARPEILSISLSGDADHAVIAIELSGTSPYSVDLGDNRIDVDLPSAAWGHVRSAAALGRGLVTFYRKQAAVQGARIVFRTAGRGLVADTEMVARENGAETLTITVQKPLPAATVLTPDTGPLVIEGAGIYPSTSVSPGIATIPVVRPSVACTGRTVRTGTLDGSPVYAFSKCPE